MNKRIFDITAYGAVGDGRTDCTAAIQAALDAAAETGRSQVLVPPGIYATGRLRMHGECVALEGCSAWSFGLDGASVLALNDPTTDCLLDITGAFGCAVRGVCMRGNHLGKNIHGIYLHWPEYNGGGKEDTPCIDDCRIGGFTGDGLHLSHIWCYSVRHSMLHGNDGAGLYMDGWDAFLIDNWFTGNKNGGLLGGPVVASITCTGNRVEWNHRGGFVLPNGDSFNITGNFFDRSFGPALELGSPEGGVDLVTVTGNIFRRSGAYPPEQPFDDPQLGCHLRMTHAKNTVVTGNSMRIGRNDGNTGVLSPDYSFVITDCTDCIIRDNTMAGGALKQNLVLQGDNSSCVITENIGGIAH